MEVRAISSLGRACPNGVSLAPAFAGFVVTHRGNHVFVDVPRFFQLSGVTSRMLFRQLGDRAVERHELVRLKVALHKLWIHAWRVRRYCFCHCVIERRFVFMTRCCEAYCYVETQSNLL